MTDSINIYSETNEMVDVVKENNSLILNQVWLSVDKRDNEYPKYTYTSGENDKISSFEVLTVSSYNINFKNLLNNIENYPITNFNLEDILCLNKFQSFEQTADKNSMVKTVYFTDNEDMTLAVLNINRITNKIYIQAFAPIFPNQGFMPPKKVHSKILAKAKLSDWFTEFGGINYFDGNIETRYKDKNDRVMAAIISKPDGEIDTIVEYQYQNNTKFQMEHTSQFGFTKTIYDTDTNSAILIIDIDTTGNIYGITTQISSSIL